VKPPATDHRGLTQESRANRPTEDVVTTQTPIGPLTTLVERLDKRSPVEADAALDAIRRDNKPRGRKQREIQLKTQQALLLFSQGWSINDAADHLGVAKSTLVGWLTRHKAKVSAAEISHQLDDIAVPLAVVNLTHGLLAGDKDYTLETLKGRGQFRRHSEAKLDVPTELPPLRIVFEAPTLPDRPTEKLVTGTVVGRPAIPLAAVGESDKTPTVVGSPAVPQE
jgi:predicted DNA-binding protein (UPF0251 family)